MGGDLNPFGDVQQHVLVVILIVKHLSHTNHPSHTHDARQRGVHQRSKEEGTQEAESQLLLPLLAAPRQVRGGRCRGAAVANLRH